MSENIKNTEENVLFGIIGAFLFSLAGGVLYVLLGLIGFIAAISGLVGVVCAIRGYTLFAKAESKKGIIISVIIAALVLVLAWYVGFAIDMCQAYQYWYESGEIDFTVTFFEYLPFAYMDMSVNPGCFVDLAMSLILGGVGCASYVGTMLKKKKAEEAQAAEQNKENL